MGITKNVQTEDNIRIMAKVAFPDKEMHLCTELTQGCCNAAYRVEFNDGSVSILKVASSSGQGLMTNEVNMMETEVKALKLVEESGCIRVPKIYYYDKSKTICTGEYFFMECIEGENFFWVQDSFSEEEKEAFFYENGRCVAKIAGIKGEGFGQLGDEAHFTKRLFELVYRLIYNVINDAKTKQVDIVYDGDEILSLLKADEYIFDEVTEPVLVHYDLWDGNFFVKDKKISGIIDWERAMWGEALMEDRFRRHTRNEAILKGYGKQEFTKEEMRRINWYDVLLYLTMMTEGSFREYPDDSQYQWVRPLFVQSYEELRANSVEG